MRERQKLLEEEGIFDHWSFMGCGLSLGGKTEDLLAFEKTKPELVKVLPGLGFDISFWSDFLAFNQLSGEVSPSEILAGEIPPSLRSANKRIIEQIPTRSRLILRSSAVGEKGGTGIYESDFIILSGDNDLDLARLAQAEKKVYAGYVTEEVKIFRLKTGFGDEGMGLLLQPLLGERISDHFLPALSGVCYEENGEQLIRLVIGLGTKAVAIDEAVQLSRKNSLSLEEIKSRLGALTSAEAINLKTGKLEKIPISEELLKSALEQCCNVEYVWMELLKGEKPYYWEFVIDKYSGYSKPVIVQSSLEIANQKAVEMEEPEGKVLYEGEDVVNIGSKRGRGIIWSLLNPDDLARLERFNQENKDYLLVLPDVAFSNVISGRPTVNFKHFSNAAAVIELQYPPEQAIPGLFNPRVDHRNKRGGTHFTELCKRTDILFIGVNANDSGNPGDILGRVTETIGNTIDFWNVDFKVTSTKDQGRVEVLGQSESRKYPKRDFFDWADEFYQLASSLERNGGDSEILSKSFFEVLDIFITVERDSFINFDPFHFLENLTPEMSFQLLNHVQKVRENIWLTESYGEYIEYADYEKETFPLDEYLAEVEERLKDLVIK